jgi:hypothetical protein
MIGNHKKVLIPKGRQPISGFSCDALFSRNATKQVL